jgi:hypothetical protein
MLLSAFTALALVGAVDDSRLWDKDGLVVVPYEFRAGTPQVTMDKFYDAMFYLETIFNRQLIFVPKNGPQKELLHPELLRLSWLHLKWIHFFADQSNLGYSDHIGAGSPVSISTRNSDIVEMDVLDDVTAWYSDNSYSTGTVGDPDGISGKGRSAVAWPVNPRTGAAYGSDQVVAIETKSNGRVYAWYNNGYYSSGTAAAPGSVSAPAKYATGKISVPGGLAFTLSPNDVVGVAFSGVNRLYAYYKTSASGLLVSRGDETDFSSGWAPRAAHLPDDLEADQIVAMAFDRNNHLWTWLTDGILLEGTATDLEFYGRQGWKNESTSGLGTSVHEIMHALGFYHEQQRPDRDAYLNVINGADKWALEAGAKIVNGYDFASVMQYAGATDKATRIDGSLYDMQRSGLSFRDVEELSLNYGFSYPSQQADIEAHEDILIGKTGRGIMYSPAAGYSSSDILGVDVSINGRFYAWYSFNGGRRSCGTSYDLDRACPSAKVTFPSLNGARFTVDEMRAAAISDNDNTYTWYSRADESCPSGLWRTSGSTQNPGSSSAAVCVTMPDGYLADNVMDIALGRLNGNQTVFAFYDDGRISAGSTANLGSLRGPTEYSFDRQRTPHKLVGFAIESGTAYFFYRNYIQVRDPEFISRWEAISFRPVEQGDIPPPIKKPILLP